MKKLSLVIAILLCTPLLCQARQTRPVVPAQVTCVVVSDLWPGVKQVEHYNNDRLVVQYQSLDQAVARYDLGCAIACSIGPKVTDDKNGCSEVQP